MHEPVWKCRQFQHPFAFYTYITKFNTVIYINRNTHRNSKRDNRRYQTSPALCTPIIPFLADRPHHLRLDFLDSDLHLPGILNDPFCRIMLLAIEWSLLQWMRQQQLQRRLSMLLNSMDNPAKLALPLGISSLCWRTTEPRPYATCTEKLVKIVRRTCGSRDMLAGRQTHTYRRAHHNTLPPLPRAK